MKKIAIRAGLVSVISTFYVNSAWAILPIEHWQQPSGAQVWLVRAAGPLEGVDLRSFRTLEEALSAARRLYPDGRVLALAQAPLVLPLPKEETS